MAHESLSSDTGFGIGVLFSVLAVAAAAWMAVTSPEAMIGGDLRISAIAFAFAMVAGIVGIVGIHLFWE